MVLYRFKVAVSVDTSSIEDADIKAIDALILAHEIQSNIATVDGVIGARVETDGDIPRLCNACGCTFFVREGNMRKVYCSYKCNRDASVQRFREKKKRITQETEEAK